MEKIYYLTHGAVDIKRPAWFSFIVKLCLYFNSGNSWP